MLLSEMFGVELDTEFGVEGYSVTFKVATFLGEYEYLMYRWSDRLDWREAEGTMLCSVIAGAPGNIVRLPPPLTDEQREQLRALYTLTFRWIVKNKKGAVIAYSHKPYRYDEYWATEKVDANIQSVAKELSVCSLVSWSDPEPYDIGKALGVEG